MTVYWSSRNTQHDAV